MNDTNVWALGIALVTANKTSIDMTLVQNIGNPFRQGVGFSGQEQ